MIDQKTTNVLGEAFSVHSTYLPEGIERISVGQDSRPDGVHTTVVGWAGEACWVLAHTVCPLSTSRPLAAGDEIRLAPGFAFHGTEAVNEAMQTIRGRHVVWDEKDDPSQPEEADEPVTSTEGAVSFIAQVSGRTIQRWVRNGAPVLGRDRRGLIFDLVALADWLIEIERDSERLGTKTVGSLTVADLRGPRRRITMHISRRQQEAARLKAAKEDRFVESSRRAIEAAAVIEDAAAVVGWSEIEAITGLRHVPSTGRAA